MPIIATRLPYYLLLTMITVPALITDANAALAENLMVSPQALSMGNAVTADPPGVYAIHYNPAGLVKAKEGRVSTLSLLAPAFETGATFSAPEGYNVFGFSDDPVVQPHLEGFDNTSFTDKIALYVPGGDLVEPTAFTLPTGGITYRPPGSKFVFATAGYAPLALGYQRGEDDPGRFGAESLVLERITLFSPSIAVELNDTMAFGASIGFSYSAFFAELEMRSPNELIGLLRFLQREVCPVFDGVGSLPLLPAECFGSEEVNPFEEIASVRLEATDPLGLSYNLGFLWQPTEAFALGIAYQSPAEMNFRGEFKFTNNDSIISTFDALQSDPLLGPIIASLGLPTNIAKEEEGDLRLDLTLPEHLAIGTRFMLSDRLQLNIDWHWTDWEEWSKLNILLNRPVALAQIGSVLGATTPTQLTIPQGFRSSANLAIGLKYHYSPRLEMRMGWEPRKSSVPDDKISLLAPLADANLYGAGVTYAWTENLKLDLSVAYLTSSASVPANGSTNLNSTGLDNIVYNPYAGLNVDLETEVILVAVTVEARF